MSAEIIKPFGLSPPIEEPNGEVVTKLKTLLEKAERGEITGFVGTTIDPGGAIASIVADGSASCFLLLSGIRLLERDFIRMFWP